MQDFWIEYRHSVKDFSVSTHIEHQYQVVIVTEGRIAYTVGDKTYSMTRGDMIVLNTLEEHDLEVLEYPYSRYIFKIAPEFFQNEVKYPEIISIFVSRLPGFSHMCTIPVGMWSSVQAAAEQMLEEFKRQDRYWKLMVGNGLREIFIPLFRAHPESFGSYTLENNAELAFRVQNYLDQHYLEEVNIDELAKRFFVHRSTLSHTFKAVTGYSVVGYVISLRLNKARALLLQDKLSVSEIAIECGYSDFAHFSKQFRKYESCSPSDYRKRALAQKGSEQNGT